MKALSLILIFLAALSTSRPAPTIHTAQTSPSPVPGLKKKKDSIDAYLAAHSKQVITLVKVPGKAKLVRVFGKKMARRN